MSPSKARWTTAFVLGTASWVAVATAQSCPGDLNHDNQVTVDEILVAVNSDVLGCPTLASRFVDNGDDTVTDTQTGLMWEKKHKYNPNGSPDPSDPHNAGNMYTWWTGSADTVTPNGTAFTEFLVKLNDCSSPDGKSLTGGFAGYCDWRLPTIIELQSIVDQTAPGCGAGLQCIAPIFGPTDSFYWSGTLAAPGGPGYAWGVGFAGGGDVNGGVVVGNTVDEFAVRAVRGNSWRRPGD